MKLLTNKPPSMSNKQLPAETIERIKADAAKATNEQDERLRGQSKDYGRRISFLDGYEDGYIAGATAEAAKTERLIEIMQEVIRISDRKHDAWDRAKEFIQQWKEGKEVVTNPCPNCGKELRRDRNLCCRECGMEVGNPVHTVSIGDHINYCHDCGFPVDECNCPDQLTNPPK